MLTAVGAIVLTPKLSQWLELKGWEQKDLAQEIGEDRTLVSMWFNGKRTPTDRQKMKLCLITGLDIGDLFTFDRTLKNEGDE